MNASAKFMEVTAMRKIKELIFSENGMKAVNTLFFSAMLFYRSVLLFVAYIVWICYLVFCIRNTESRGSKVVYSVLDRKSTRLNSSHSGESRMPSSA